MKRHNKPGHQTTGIKGDDFNASSDHSVAHASGVESSVLPAHRGSDIRARCSDLMLASSHPITAGVKILWTLQPARARAKSAHRRLSLRWQSLRCRDWAGTLGGAVGYFLLRAPRTHTYWVKRFSPCFWSQSSAQSGCRFKSRKTRTDCTLMNGVCVRVCVDWVY